ncbi:MAG TPA: hypothetical protein VFW49_08265 [Fluviicoccus sp.]|nr:hypothetical protein [Fluviicoccus sp.]
MKAEALLAGLLLTGAGHALAADPPDPALLEYLEAFADDQGNVFDPADLDTATRVNTPATSDKPEPKPHE